jgi:hypothetical protein
LASNSRVFLSRSVPFPFDGIALYRALVLDAEVIRVEFGVHREGDLAIFEFAISVRQVVWALSAMVFEELDSSLMLFRLRPSGERAQVSPLSSAWIDLARVETVLSGFQLANHGSLPFSVEIPNGELPQIARHLLLARPLR